MFTWQRLSNCLLFVPLMCAVAFAQEKPPGPRPNDSPPITMATTGAGVRFTAIGAVERMRLEVFDAGGESVFDTGFKPGNVRDWRLTGAHGGRLLDGTYLCAVTVRELTGRLSFKQGSILVQDGQASLALDGGGQGGAIEAEQALTRPSAAEPAAMTVVAHDGRDGQVTSTTGALTFRTGDIFTGTETERMRIAPDGRVGIGTTSPTATLDVAGVVRAGKGIAFSDGTVLTSATGRAQKLDAKGEPEPLISGSGTTGRLAKWTNGPAEVLGDSIVTETAGGNIGIGTGSPTSKLHVVGSFELGGSAAAGTNPTLSNPNNLANYSQLLFYPAAGTNVNSSFSIIPRGTGQPNNRAQLVLLNTDRIASPANFEFASLRARGNDFLLATGKAGTGLDRPLMLSAGLLTNNITNLNQLFLATDGNVGMGTNTPMAKLHVAGNVRLTGLRTEETDNVPNVIGGFSGNSVTAGVIAATIGGGGSGHRVTDNYGTVSGGRGNRAGDAAGTVDDSREATVGGGSGNTASGNTSTIGGGANNTASGNFSTVGGGTIINSSGEYSTVGGGHSNTASGYISTVGGGSGNTASGEYSTVPGGSSNRAEGRYSFAAGVSARALHQGSFVWADFSGGIFASTANNQFLIRAGGGVGINTNDPKATLGLVGTSGNANFFMRRSGAANGINFGVGAPGPNAPLFIAQYNGTTYLDRLIINTDGTVSVNTLAAATGTHLCINGTKLANCSSSLRYKERVAPFNAGLDLLSRLRPVTFKWKEREERDLGLIAEEVNRVEPLLVTRDSVGEIQGVKYDQLSVVLINAVREQQSQISQQQGQLKQQQSQLEQQRNQIEGLKRLLCLISPDAEICR